MTEAPVESEAPGDDDDENDSNEESNQDDDDSQEDDDHEPSYTPRSRENLERILGLTDSEASKELSGLVDKATQTILKELKGIYENAIKPLETTYKYRDLSNRHFGGEKYHCRWHDIITEQLIWFWLELWRSWNLFQAHGCFHGTMVRWKVDHY